ncbi:unnamed protein product, partial [Mesorhabditis spiculigera]
MKAAVVCFLALLAVAAATQPAGSPPPPPPPSGKPPAPGGGSQPPPPPPTGKPAPVQGGSQPPAPAASKAPLPASPVPASKAPAPSAAAPAATSAKPAGRRSVENFCLVYVGSAATVNLCHFFWGCPCAIWELNDSFEAGSLVFGFVANASVCYMYTARIPAGYGTIATTAFCELIVLILLVKRQASIPGRQSQHGLRRQFRFAGQLVTHTLSSMLLTVLSNIAYGGGEDIFSTFLLFTASWQASCLCACSLYIVFHAMRFMRFPT